MAPGPKLPGIQLAANEHYIAIAKVVSNWATFELMIASSLWILAGVDDDPGACLTAQIPNGARLLDAFIALVRLRGGDDTLIRQINKFAEATQKLNLKRNRVVHDPWVAEVGTGRPHRVEISAAKRLIFEYQHVPTDELNALVDAIADHSNRFDEIMETVQKLEAFPKKRP
jgi:hypothetical protein